jgi:hypothetical protein
MSKKAARMLSGLLVVVLLAVAVPIVAGHETFAQAQPRLSHLDIAVWPEFDEPLTWADDRPPALVIIRGELASDTVLPTSLSLRIPAAAGQPYAVASSTQPNAGLVNREYETAMEGDSLRITLETPDPVVHVEFYLPMAGEGFQRDLTYVWPGDLAADSVTLRVQIPVGAEDFQTEPELGPAEVGDLDLLYRQTTLGALEAGQTLSLRIQYSKQDPRLTIDTLPETQPTGGGDGGIALPWPVLAAMAAVLLVGIVALAWYRLYQRRPAPVRLPSGGARGSARYCTQCGQALSVENRFCSKCGTPVRKQP